MSIIAIDYDKTYDTNPEKWDKVIDILEEYGDEVIIVSSKGAMEYYNIIGPPGVDVYTTGGTAKKKYMKHLLGEKVDIWIDNNPKSIIKDNK